jgi:hypothetical protein
MKEKIPENGCKDLLFSFLNLQIGSLRLSEFNKRVIKCKLNYPKKKTTYEQAVCVLREQLDVHFAT